MGTRRISANIAKLRELLKSCPPFKGAALSRQTTGREVAPAGGRKSTGACAPEAPELGYGTALDTQ